VAELERRLAGFGADFAAAREWRYGMFSLADGTTVGEVDLFARDAAGRVPYERADRAEIGYWVRADLAGTGLASEATRAMLDVAATLSRVERVEIRCDARNGPSAAIPKKLGFVLERTEEEPGDPVVQLQVWSKALTGPSPAPRS
jgi:RimJ/RimL family protein N-acetyltransferase